MVQAISGVEFFTEEGFINGVAAEFFLQALQNHEAPELIGSPYLRKAGVGRIYEFKSGYRSGNPRFGYEARFFHIVQR